MNRNDLREALKWSLLAAVLVACWYSVQVVRKARASEVLSSPFSISRVLPAEDTEATSGLMPVWVIVVFEVQTGKLVGITEFVFPTYDACIAGAEQARQELGLQIVPACYLRWLKALPGEPA